MELSTPNIHINSIIGSALKNIWHLLPGLKIMDKENAYSEAEMAELKKDLESIDDQKKILMDLIEKASEVMSLIEKINPRITNMESANSILRSHPEYAKLMENFEHSLNN